MVNVAKLDLLRTRETTFIARVLAYGRQHFDVTVKCKSVDFCMRRTRSAKDRLPVGRSIRNARTVKWKRKRGNVRGRWGTFSEVGERSNKINFRTKIELNFQLDSERFSLEQTNLILRDAVSRVLMGKFW